MYLKQYAILIATVSSAYALGRYIDMMEVERLTYFRDKSALFGRELKPGEPPSWP